MMIQRLAINLKIVRKERWRMSQDRFAQLFDSSRSKINSYENGGVEPSIAFILRLQELTNISALDLFYGTINTEQIPPFPLEKGQAIVESNTIATPLANGIEELIDFQKKTNELLQGIEDELRVVKNTVAAK